MSEVNGTVIAGALQTPHIVTKTNAILVHSLFGSTSGSGSVGEKYALNSESSEAHIKITNDAHFYLGNPSVDGSWRWWISGADLVYEKRIAGVWTVWSTILG